MSKYVGDGALRRLLNIVRAEFNELKTNIINIPISNSKTITEEYRYALDVIQNNPSVDGSLANQIQTLRNELVFRKGEVYDKSTIWHFGYGFCSTDHKIIWLNFPLPKRLDTAPTQLDIVDLQIFADKGAVDSINMSYTFRPATKQGQLHMVITLNDTSPLNAIISDSTAKQVCLTSQLKFTMTV